MSKEINKESMLEEISRINAVENFDASAFEIEMTDLNTGKSRVIIPVAVQLAWFRMKYPEGKIATTVKQLNGEERFLATVKVYASYKDDEGCYLAEASAIKSRSPENPEISAIEWAQTTAIGVALRNAGFGLLSAVKSFDIVQGNEAIKVPETKKPIPIVEVENQEEEVKELTLEEKVQEAMKVVCPIAKYKGMTFGELLRVKPDVLDYVARKYEGDENVIQAAKLICDYSLSQVQPA